MNMDSQEGKLERIPPTNGVYQNGGKWFMRYDDQTDGAELPRRIASIFKAALSLEEKALHNREVGRAIDPITCHETVFYVIGLISREDIRKSLACDYSLFPKEAFLGFPSLDGLVAHVRNSTGGSIGIVQKKSLYSGVYHSFFVGFDSDERCVCFEKAGTGAPFQIVPLEIIYERSNKDVEWAVGSLNDVMKSQTVASVRTLMNNSRLRELKYPR